MHTWLAVSRSRELMALIGALAASCLVTACPVEPSGVARPGFTSDNLHAPRYYLQVANESDDRVIVRIWLTDTAFELHETLESGLIVLNGGEKASFLLFANSYACGSLPEEHNKLISSFNRVEFYDEDSAAPYRNYYYRMVRCGARASTGDEYMHQSSTGIWENLFVESPDRPFYLERDQRNSYLARIVITFVPSAEADSASALG